MIIAISGKQQSGKDFSAEEIKKLLPNHNWKIVKFADKVKDIVCLLIGCTRLQLENITFKNTPLGKEWEVWKVQLCDNGKMIFSTYDEVKKYCELYGYADIDNIAYNDLTIEYEMLTPRNLMQLIGTNAGRNIVHPSIWINATMIEYEKENKYPNWIITDLRFPNEAEAIKKRNSILIRLERPIEQRWPGLYAEYQNYIVAQEKLFFLADSVDMKIEVLPFRSWIKRFNNDIWKTLVHESEVSLDDYDKFDHIIKNDTTEELITALTKILEPYFVLNKYKK